MLNRFVVILITAGLVVLLLAAYSALTQPALAGGWAVVTLDSLPEHVIAGEAVTVGFVVRQHGVQITDGLAPVVTLTHPSGAESLAVSADEDAPGHYTADLVFSDAGTWTWAINGFGMEQPMPALEVLPARAADEQIAYGAALFVAKGCAVCHTHSGVEFDPFSTINTGPDLGPYTNDPVFLRKWLHDPAATKPGATMPALGLDDAEIDALIAFLLAE